MAWNGHAVGGSAGGDIGFGDEGQVKLPPGKEFEAQDHPHAHP